MDHLKKDMTSKQSRIITLILFILLFLVFFGLSHSILDEEPRTAHLPLRELEAINDLALRVGDLLERDEDVKNAEIQRLIDDSSQGELHLLYRDYAVKLHPQGKAPLASGFMVFDTYEDGHYSLKIPVGRKEVKGVLAVKRVIPPQTDNVHLLEMRMLFSLSLSIFVLALIYWLRSRRLISSVEHLCRKFTRYRRETESDYLELPEEYRMLSPLDRRIRILDDFWEKFHSIQLQLAHKVNELEQSKRELEQSKRELEISNEEKERANQLLTQSNHQLEVKTVELEEINFKLENTIHDLEKAKQQEQRLVELGYALAEFGHDIGNANGSILSFVGLLLQILESDNITMDSIAKCIPFIRRIRIASDSIQGLTTDILEFAKGKTDLRVTLVPIETMINNLDVNFAFANDIEIEFRYPPEPGLRLKVDEGKIVRVLVNMVKNAWEKFQVSNEQEVEPMIWLDFQVDQQHNLIIRVIDNGPPIPTDVEPLLFQSFQTSGKEKGTGLGLAICKKIVEAHGGWVRASNLPDNHGVEFCIFLNNAAVVPGHGK